PLAWSTGAVALACLAVVTHESRLQLASIAYVVLDAGAAFHESPPTQLIVAHTHPAHGVLGLLLLTAAVLVLARTAREQWRAGSLWLGGLLLVYAASLGILELSVHVFSASRHTNFQRGHSAVSALWGLLGLSL